MAAGPGQPKVSAVRTDQRWESDCTNVSSCQGWLRVAVVIDVFAGRIVVWRITFSMRLDFVLGALEHALCALQPDHCGGLIRHSERWSVQYVNTRCTKGVAVAGTECSGGGCRTASCRGSPRSREQRGLRLFGRFASSASPQCCCLPLSHCADVFKAVDQKSYALIDGFPAVDGGECLSDEGCSRIAS